MNVIGIIAGSTAALGIGFGVGIMRPTEFGENGATVDSSEAVPITFKGGSPSGNEKPAEGSRNSAQFSYTKFADAKPRLEELLAEYIRLSPNLRYSHPLPGERILEEVERILALAGTDDLVTFLTMTSDGNSTDVFEIALTALARLSPQRAAEVGMERWNFNPKSPPGLLAVIRE